MSEQNGNRLNGIIREVNQEIVRMDFNHQLACAMLPQKRSAMATFINPLQVEGIASIS